MEKVKIFKSNVSISAQLVLDGKTIVGKTFKFVVSKKKPVEQSFEFGKEFAVEIKAKKVNKISFDRGKNRYHGIIKQFAEGMRQMGIEF